MQHPLADGSCKDTSEGCNSFEEGPVSPKLGTALSWKLFLPAGSYLHRI